MSQKKITISSTPEHELEVKKFMYHQMLEGNVLSRSEIARKGDILFMANEIKKVKRETV